MQDDTSCAHDWRIRIRKYIPIGVSKHCNRCSSYLWKKGEVSRQTDGSIHIDGKVFVTNIEILSSSKIIEIDESINHALILDSKAVSEEIANKIMDEGDDIGVNVTSLDEDTEKMANLESKVDSLKRGPFTSSDFTSVEGYEDIPLAAARAANYALKMMLEDL